MLPLERLSKPAKETHIHTHIFHRYLAYGMCFYYNTDIFFWKADCNVQFYNLRRRDHLQQQLCFWLKLPAALLYITADNKPYDSSNSEKPY